MRRLEHERSDAVRHAIKGTDALHGLTEESFDFIHSCRIDKTCRDVQLVCQRIETLLWPTSGEYPSAALRQDAAKGRPNAAARAMTTKD